MMQSQLTVATYNVHRCIGRDGRRNPERTLSVLRELKADVVALQELEWQPDDALHLLEDFARDTGFTAIAGPTLAKEKGHYGNALLTRLAVRDTRRLDLSVPGREPRGALDVLLDAPNGRLRVLATHLGLRPGERREQMKHLLANLTLRTVPTVLMGDLNEWFLWGRPLRWLYAHFGKTPAPATFPSVWPIFALDRIWGEPKRLISGLSAHSSALARMASDHLPLRAVVSLSAAAAGREPGGQASGARAHHAQGGACEFRARQ